MKKTVHLFWNSLFFLSLFASCTPDSLSESSNAVTLQPSFNLAPVQAEIRSAETAFQPEEGSRFTIERTDDHSTPAAVYSIKSGEMVSDAPLLLPKAGNYPFRIYGKSGSIPVALYDEATVNKEGKAHFSLSIVCAAMQVNLQDASGSSIAAGQAEITLPNLNGTGEFNTDFTVADETAIAKDGNTTPSGHNEEDILFHPDNALAGGEELITINYSGRTYRYSPSTIPDFSARKRYIYTLRLGTEKAELVTVDIADFKPFILTKDTNNNLAGIYTEEDLISFREAINSGSSIAEWSVTEEGNQIIYLYNDIVLTKEWTPINDLKKLRFYGNGHTISNITIKQAGTYNGFFGRITGGSIVFNLNLSDIHVEYTPAATSYCGIICGFASGSTIQSVHMKRIVANTTVQGNFNVQMGGCAGQSKSTKIKDINIEDASITGTGNSKIYFGGISGYANISTMEKIILSNMQVSMTGGANTFIGGISGYTDTSPIIKTRVSDIQLQGTCTGESDKYAVYAGGVVGENGKTCPIQEASLYNIEIKPNAKFNIYSGGMIGSNDIADSPISQSKLTNITITSSTSKLIINCTGGVVGYNLAPLENIELNNIKSTAEAMEIYSTPDQKSTSFLCNGGVIGYNQACLHNIHANSLQITTSSPVETTIDFIGSGGIVGFCFNSKASPTLTQCSVDQCTVKGYRAGGIIGYNYSASLIGCAATNVDIYSNLCCGGLIGYNYQGKNIFGCYSTGKVTITGDSTDKEKLYAGGLIGRGGNTIEVSYSTCDVTNPSEDNDNAHASSYAGSFIGGPNRVYSTSCYATGSVNGGQDRHFIGDAYSYENSEICFCYTTQTAFVNESRAPAQLGGSANWDKISPLPEEILRSKASITLNGITWKASSLWLAPGKRAHPVINMNYHGE